MWGGEPTVPGLLRASATLLGIAAGIVVYTVGFVWLARQLHLDFEAAYWLGFGILLVLIGAIGASPLLSERRSFMPVAVYLLIIGLGGAAAGAYRQFSISRGRAECGRDLADAGSVHQRIDVYQRSVRGVPSLSGGPSRRLTCRDVLP